MKGELAPDPNVALVVFLDISRLDVLEGRFAEYESVFEGAGFKAGLASRRRSEAILDDYLADPDEREAIELGRLRWVVVLNGIVTA